MKAEAIQLVAGESDPATVMNLLREYLQAITLRSLHESEAFSHLAFVGGTALRFAYGLPRFSEDMDFSLENPVGYDPEQWLRKLKNDMELSGLPLSVNWNDRTTVHKAWLKWPSILNEVGLSPMADQKLSIKLEIDTKPPAGAVCERQIVTKHRLLALQLYDRPSLMAGKIHALITRGFPKGRDWYDLLWYCGQRPAMAPNMMQLQNALDQTQGEGIYDASVWKQLCINRIEQLEVAELASDVAPFLEHREEAALLTAENIKAVLASAE
jgi:predicted nucleotidyltransferase component of viral defense system